jgi:tetratricopeptide (TPR) repeat protein
MNLFARILSHGFALAVVALLAIGLIYRGELFPDLELPEFLSFGSSGSGSETSAEAPPPQEESAQPSDEMAAFESTGSAPAADHGVVESVEVEAFAPTAADEASPPAEPAPAAVESADEAATLPAADAVEAEAVPAVPEAAEDMTSTGMETGASADSEPETAPAAEAEPVPEALQDISEAAEAGVQSPAGAGVEESAADMAAGAPAEIRDSSQDDAAPVPAFVETEQSEAAAGTASASADTVDEQQAEAEPAPAIAGTSSYRLLAAAREAYWLRDYEQAEQQYRALIAMDPENPDGYGELGNMYFSQGDWEKAAAAYYDAGVRLVDQGLADHAMQLVEVIRGLNGTQASQLEEKIRSSSAPAAN